MRNSAASVQLELNAGGDATPAEVDTLTRSLRQDLLELDLDSVGSPAVTDLPDDAKTGAAHTAGVLVASGVISASTIKAIATVVTAWLHRSEARSVTIQRGDDRIEITAASQGNVDTLVDQWLAHQSTVEPAEPEPGTGETSGPAHG